MSPGSSTQSSRGSKLGSIFSGTSSRRRGSARGRRASAAAPRSAAGRRRRNRRAGRRRRRRSRRRPSTSSRRASATKRKRSSSACARSSCRSTPCTSSVQPGCASGGSARRANGPGRTDQRSPARDDEARFDVVARRQREQPRRRSKPGKRVAARRARISSGFFCQWRRMNAGGDRPPSRAVGSIEIHGSLCDDRFDADRRPLRRQPDLATRRRARRRDRRAERAGRVLLSAATTCWPRSRRRSPARRPATRRRFTSSPSMPSASTTPKLVFFEERAIFPEAVEPGMQFDGPPPGREDDRTCPRTRSTP